MYFGNAFSGYWGSPDPINSAGLFPLTSCSCRCSGKGLMDLLMTATWHSCLGCGKHLSSSYNGGKEEQRYIFYIEGNDYGCISIANSCRFVNHIKGY